MFLGKRLYRSLTCVFIFLGSDNLLAQFSFFPRAQYNIGASLQSIDIGDLNNDCLNDVVVSNSDYLGLPLDNNLQWPTQMKMGQKIRKFEWYFFERNFRNSCTGRPSCTKNVGIRNSVSKTVLLMK